MEITTAHANQGLFRRPVRITQLEKLNSPELPVQPPPLSLGTTVYVSRHLRLEPFSPVKESTPKEPKRVSLADATKNLGIGGGLAAGSLGLIPLSKSTTEAKLSALLTSYGFTPSASDQLASSSLSFARSNAGQICCFFLTGGFTTLGIVEAIKPDWAWKRKLLIALMGGLALVLIILVLHYFGIWGHPAK